ncbi:MAG: low molecular weight protein-tyrosine-phosphatase [Psychroserpens sp.]|uniref:low molecular weight protein-tyrosine-phosphatase n=1 Tax=Psychroserpens sp. TaxID=2020870 RepID=UPI003C7609D0
MTNILMVCLGNICRSPLAHGLLESKLPQDSFYIDSAGTGNFHIGDPPDHRSIAVAKSNGIDISNQQARQFKVSDFDAFDFIYVMDQSNYDNVIALARHDSDKEKVSRILKVVDNVGTKNVPDPYHGDLSDFEHVFSLLNNACTSISKSLLA